MEGVTTAIVAFIFVCVVFPHLVKTRPQFYAALAAAICILLVQALAIALGSPAFGRVVGFLTALLQVIAILLLFLSCGGLSARELMSDMGNAIEVIRRGEQEKEVIIPITGQQPKPRRDRAPERYAIDEPDEAPRPRSEAPRRPEEDEGIPLE